MTEQLSLLDINLIQAPSYREKLIALLSDDLNFHSRSDESKSHNFHSFPAKFPPQLPRKFINELTAENDVILDPMAGSGTTILEALLAHRQGIGFDIDPLALKIASVKVTALDVNPVIKTGNEIIEKARAAYSQCREELLNILDVRWDIKTREFIDYWFAKETQLELLALTTEIKKIHKPELRGFFELVLSAIIITKSGGVSLALDLAHTRPHKAKIIVSKGGEVILDQGSNNTHPVFMTKILRSAFDEFEKRFRNNLDGLIISTPKTASARVLFGNAESLPLSNDSVDLIITSPPYASNAIDYMRAHKFSLVWLGYPIEDLGEKRKLYIGAEAITSIKFEKIPTYTQSVLNKLTQADDKKSIIVYRYYSEMTRVLKELYRVLKPGKAAVVVIGSSIIHGIDIETQNCLADIGKNIGFEVPKVGVRSLDRNKRMLPAGSKIDKNSQIQQRMHQEFIIGFYKPEK